MPIYNHPADIYLNDVELFELLSSKNIAHRDLLRLARRRGYIFSEKTADEDVRNLLAMYPSDWDTVNRVLEAASKPEPEEQQSTSLIKNCGEDNDVSAILKQLKENRSHPQGETFKVNKVGDAFHVDVAYTEIDLSKALIYQRRAKSISIEVEKKDGEISIRYSANGRAKAIVDEIQGRIRPKKNAVVEKFNISLRAVTKAADRTAFFSALIKGIKGFKYLNAPQLSVDRRLPGDDELEEDDGVKAKDAKKELKGLVHRVALSGEQVLTSELYQEANRTGYYIYHIRWTCFSTDEPRVELDLDAGFEDAVNAEGFRFDVIKKRVQDKKTGKLETIVVSPAERRQIRLLIEAAAFDAYKKIQQKQSKKD